ncbi:hypothetical protein CANINC_004689 [Pichia inconspicua]|uniref:Uncharacterized protein n=1 Tax=Pichia inconspicua TaxID=52247 RepID=A0A4T0WX52_9ASCO|nr:hypothetical protein CANINC_004689 [[Candida] inconspicua]
MNDILRSPTSATPAAPSESAKQPNVQSTLHLNTNTNPQSTSTSSDIFLAATALETLKKQQQSPNQQIPSSTNSTSTPTPTPTLLDKMISHPIISNSINYVLERTRSTSSNVLEQSVTTTITTTRKRTRNHINDDQIDPLDKKVLPQLKKRAPIDLRHQASISSALSIQRSLEEVKQLSSLNIAIESRRKLTMLIHFLKLGNNQLSERINKLIDSVDTRREKLKLKQGKERTKSAAEAELDATIHQIKTDIVTTVKKIVNVVSTVSAQSLSEPARSNVREALLKLPANWATMLNNECISVDEDYDEDDEIGEDDDDDEDDDDEEEEEDGDNEDGDKNNEVNETITVTNTQIFQRRRKQSITRRLLDSFVAYRRTRGQNFDENTKKLKAWVKAKIRNHFLHDSSGGKVLILAQESLDMVNKIIAFCNESLEKAESWNNDKQLQQQSQLIQRLQRHDT